MRNKKIFLIDSANMNEFHLANLAYISRIFIAKENIPLGTYSTVEFTDKPCLSIPGEYCIFIQLIQILQMSEPV